MGQGEEYLGVAQGTLTSVAPLSKKESTEIQKFVGQFLNKSVTLEQELDPSLLSGFVVRVDGFSLDASLKFELNEMRNLLNEKSR
jgi:F0F1-type ATP synthase delta subunit